MRFSVIIACYNATSTLGRQLEALSRQSHRGPFEVLVCDNGSTDGSRELAESFRYKLPGLRVLDASARRGAGYARNVGARASTAPWLAFCDADDEVAEGWLAALATGLRRHDFVAGRFESNRLNRPSVLRSRALQQDGGLQTSPYGPGLPHAGAGNMAVHRETFLAVGGFDPGVGCLEDTDLCWRLQLAGTELVFLPEAVVHVRLRSTLRAMWAQGRSYGAASALLEHRFRNEPGLGAGNASRRRLGRRAVAFARGQRSLGGVLWQLGWHAGHRRFSPGDAVVLAVPEPVTGPAGDPVADGSGLRHAG